MDADEDAVEVFFEQARNIKITFDSFTLDFYEDFVDFLSHEYVQARRKTVIVGLKVNTVNKNIADFLPVMMEIVEYTDPDWVKYDRLFSKEIVRRKLKANGAPLKVEATLSIKSCNVQYGSICTINCTNTSFFLYK